MLIALGSYSKVFQKIADNLVLGAVSVVLAVAVFFLKFRRA